MATGDVFDDLMDRIRGSNTDSAAKISEALKEVKSRSLAGKVEALEKQVAALSLAVVVLVNSKEKRSRAKLPSALKNGVCVRVEWDGDDAVIRLEVPA
jgi:hypothetical protein